LAAEVIGMIGRARSRSIQLPKMMVVKRGGKVGVLLKVGLFCMSE